MKPSSAFSLIIVVEVSFEALVILAIGTICVTYLIVWNRDDAKRGPKRDINAWVAPPSDSSSVVSSSTDQEEDHFSEASCDLWTPERTFNMYCEFYEGLGEEELHNLENQME